MNTKELQELFTIMQSGDKQAFCDIYSELKVPVFTIIYRIVKSKEIAEDVTQEVFVKLYASAMHIQAKNIRAYIFTMARNTAIDALRKEIKNTESINCEDQIDKQSMELNLDIEDAINSLPLYEREILTLHLNVGLKFSEIAQTVNLSLPATYRRYKKALKTLKAILNGGVL